MSGKFNLREELKVAYCLNPDVDYCDKCLICKNTDKIIDEFEKNLRWNLWEIAWAEDQKVNNKMIQKEFDKVLGEKSK